MAKLVSKFDEFLRDTVNLNQTRLDDLESNVDALKTFIKDADWDPGIRTFVPQGSWAHKTIIKPVDLGEFDADLLVLVNPVEGWTAQDYVNSLGDIFRASGVYKAKTKVWDYCVTITYAGDRKVDIAPCVVGRLYQGQREVCNRTKNTFEVSTPEEYTQWLVDQNALSGNNTFRKVTRLLKYLKGIKQRFTCSSVLLTTLLGGLIYTQDKGSTAFVDVPTALQTMIARLDTYLQARPVKPVVANPKLVTEDFAAYLTERQYKNLRKHIHRYRGWVDDAIATEGTDASISAWRKLFGDQFAKGVEVAKSNALVDSLAAFRSSLLSSGAHLSSLVDEVIKHGVHGLPTIFTRPPHLQEPEWEVDLDTDLRLTINGSVHASKVVTGAHIKSGQALFPSGYIRFEALFATGMRVPAGMQVWWRVTNTGHLAFERGQERGHFVQSDVRGTRWEPLAFRGVHFVEAFLVRDADNFLIGRSDPYFVTIS
jgi:hypothetical protein